MKLSRYTLKNIPAGSVQIPDEKTFDLPEKVLQFGTGVLLRGLPGYFIHKANTGGIFNGRIVVVKSTSSGDASFFDKQDCLYTQCVRGIENGADVSDNIINSSISRILSANSQWQKVLECAHNQQLQIIISNTTEVGIQLVNDDIRSHPPVSFPGKLLAFLYERFKAFDGSMQSGMVIIPTELIVDNGKKLESIVLELAHLNGMEDRFIDWLESANTFCNSLVDRIVPGKPAAAMLEELESSLGYTDDLLIMSEPYRLWAIQGNEQVKSMLSFSEADSGVIIAPDIDMYRELKLRLLNGTHTLSCGPAFLSGFKIVREAMEDDQMSEFIARLMNNEIAPAIPYKVEPDVAATFARNVLERFKNPQIQHPWISITMQYSSKMKMRCIPILLKHYSISTEVPEYISLGLAAYIYFMKPVTSLDGKFFGELQGEKYPINDDVAEIFFERWNTLEPADVVKEVLTDAGAWGHNLMLLPGLCNSVTENLNFIMENGMNAAIQRINSRKSVTAV